MSRSSAWNLTRRVTAVTNNMPTTMSTRHFTTTPISSSSSNRLTLSSAASYHGKPGSPAYVDPSQRDAASVEDPADSNNSGSRPDWRSGGGDGSHGDGSDGGDTHQLRYHRLKQGLPSDHPLSIWRDAQLAKEPWGAGHDWFFLQHRLAHRAAQQPTDKDLQREGSLWAGVADGVGGWEDQGIDPSHFSQALMYHARETVRTASFDLTINPKDVLSRAYDQVQAEKGVIAGSSTATLVQVEANTGKLRAANLGDSTFYILRPGPSTSKDEQTAASLEYKVIHAQPSQTHFFNAPRQLAKFPRGASKKGALIDMPRDADEYEAVVSPGDVIVLATDGFSDNVFPVELEQLVMLVKERYRKQASTPGSSEEASVTRDKDSRSLAKTLADVCVNYARICSFKPNKQSPFEIEARRYGHHDLKGGKVDDVCVVVIVVDGVGEGAPLPQVNPLPDAQVKAKL